MEYIQLQVHTVIPWKNNPTGFGKGAMWTQELVYVKERENSFPVRN
jgi:hypothetical protein